MKKKLIVAASLCAAFALGTVTASQAASTLEKIQANLNHGISFLLNGESWSPKDANGKSAAPISYQGTTYVPLRAVAEATGADIKFDGNRQQISISTGKTGSNTENPQGVRTPFNENTVSHMKWSYYTSGITRNKEDLRFGETQYQTAFTVGGVNSAGQGVAFKVKEGTKKMGVLIGFKSPKDEGKASYVIEDKNKQALATGQVGSGKVENNELVLPKGTTELYVTFKGPAGEDSTGYVIWDESWVEN
ncbi:copper amine oxidase N-terminal domain-containing protein [Paenibacillus donghaensis]|uniref:stalk domain-containing protein n=1 Tax=Paenibacillus donghaensis TaxID=414771 RepID=UPI0018837E0D|nr:stalk domain-containing protein [Paenibacillus donghaensis]MBE9915552.1 copper amine oxidase N-terminal domain-containing protein [Paenibacillus donghaensis]